MSRGPCLIAQWYYFGNVAGIAAELLQKHDSSVPYIVQFHVELTLKHRGDETCKAHYTPRRAYIRLHIGSTDLG